MLSEEGRQSLVQITRDALAAAVHGEAYTPPDPGSAELQQQCGCFVTYKTHGRLRGCLGCFTATQPLYQTVAEYAGLSATDDPRFASERLTPDELASVEIDISVLSPLVPCDDPLSIIPGTHGIYIRHGWRSGCFLPQVATEAGWGIEEFWSYCCQHKAGLPADAWRGDDVERFTFTAEVIHAPPPGT